MAAPTDIKSLTVRLQPELYEAAAQIARKRGRSLNTLVQQGLEQIIRTEENREMYEAATLLGMDAEGCDVEYAIPVAAEVLQRDEQ
jgi:predicted transcriptional regulator